MNFKGILKYNEPLADYTSWHIGGHAEVYYKPADRIDLSLFLKSHTSFEKTITFLGLGSNVLIADAGLKGIVIHWLDTQAPIEKIENKFHMHGCSSADSRVTLRVDTRVPCAKLAKFCAKQGLKNAAFLAGIPGTVGGALAMNAGAWGHEIWSFVSKVTVMNAKGDFCVREPAAYEIAYRKVSGAHVSEANPEWFVEVDLCFEAGDDPLLMSQNIKTLLKQRQQSQPIGVFSCGSVFKNPPQDYVGRLIEACGLKGYTIGGAKVSEKHANFIINERQATAEDVRALIAHIQTVVLANHQVALEPEVRFLGF
jgi:UDP-N-acetylmuramate dehydrogenase